MSMFTPLGLMNFLFLQWFGFRVMKRVQPPDMEIVGWGLLLGVLPLTGWWNDYYGWPHPPQMVSIPKWMELPIAMWLAMLSGFITGELIKLWLGIR